MRIKNGVFLAIAFILVAGSVITLSTNYVLGLNDKSGISGRISEIQEEDSIEKNETPEKISLNTKDMKVTVPSEEEAEQGDLVSPQLADISPEAFSSVPEERRDLRPTVIVEEEREIYLNKLAELERQIQKAWDEDTESTTFAMKNMAEYELSAWDKELNSIYKLLKDKLPPEEYETLRMEELQWIQMRDVEAAKSAKQYEGGTMEGLEFTMTSASLTKLRTYELVEYYFEE